MFELFFLIGASATKIWENKKDFKYGLPQDFSGKGEHTTTCNRGLN